MHRDGIDLIDDPLHVRLEHLAEVTGELAISGIVTDSSSEAEAFAAESLAIPVHPTLTPADLDRVVDAVAGYFERA